MNAFAKRMTVGFLVALLAGALIGLGGMKKTGLPLRAGEFHRHSMFEHFIQGLGLTDEAARK